MAHRKHGIVSDGQRRLRESDWHRSEEARIRQEVAAEFDPLISDAAGLGRLRLHLAKSREARRRIARLAPDEAMYFSRTRRNG